MNEMDDGVKAGLCITQYMIIRRSNSSSSCSCSSSSNSSGITIMSSISIIITVIIIIIIVIIIIITTIITKYVLIFNRYSYGDHTLPQLDILL